MNRYRHPRPTDQKQSVDWARKVLATPQSYLILDTETTGLDNAAEVIQIAIIDVFGRVLLNTLIRPRHRRSIPAEATRMHGITMEMLEGAPTWPQIAPGLVECTNRRTIISYNADYDSRLIRQTASRNGGAVPSARWECAMLQYARFRGEWNYSTGSYRWHKLSGGDHSALGDCKATLALIQMMAGSEGP